MATYGKQLLSGGTSGRNIKVVATATAGTTIHTAVAGSSDIDEVWLYACNTDSSTRKLTIEYGGVSSPDDLVELTLDNEAGWILVCPGLLLNGGLVVNGFVNRITA